MIFMKKKSKYRFQEKLAQFLSGVALFVLFSGQQSNAQFCTNFTVYALDDHGYIYPVNTSTGALQTPLNNSGVGSNIKDPNAIGYTAGKFYYISNTQNNRSPFISYDGVSTYDYSLTSGFTNSNYPVRGTGTSDGQGFYMIDQSGYLWYYKIATDVWTKVTQKIIDAFGNDISRVMRNSLGSGDLVEDGYGSLWIVMSSSSKYGIYKIPFPATTVVPTVTATEIVPYTTNLPATIKSGESFNGAAFDLAGDLFISSNTQLYKLPSASTNPVFIASFSGLKSSGNSIYDLSQCTYALSVLPVAWTYFKAALKNGSVDVDWGVEQGSSINGFYVERSNDSKNWERLTFVSYSNLNDNYTFADPNPLSGINYYRIAEIDFNNQPHYSVIRAVSIGPLSAVTIWPNPAVGVLNVRYNGVVNNATATIFDQVGRSVARVSIHQGNNAVSLDNMAPGVYIIVLEEGNKKTFYQKIIKRNN